MSPASTVTQYLVTGQQNCDRHRVGFIGRPQGGFYWEFLYSFMYIDEDFSISKSKGHGIMVRVALDILISKAQTLGI